MKLNSFSSILRVHALLHDKKICYTKYHNNQEMELMLYNMFTFFMLLVTNS